MEKQKSETGIREAATPEKEKMEEKPKNRWKRDFFLLYTGQAASLLTSNAVQFSLIWWLQSRTGSAQVLAMASIVGLLPTALLGPVAGVWADRVSRKKMMLAADAFIALCTLLLALSFLAGAPQIWEIYLVLFLRAVGSAFHTPAMQAAIPLLVPERELVRAGGLGQLVSSACALLGPALGAVLIAGLPVWAVLLSDVGGAGCAIATLVPLHFRKLPPGSEKSRLWYELREGWQELSGSPLLWAASVPAFLAVLIYLPVSSLFPLMVGQHFGGDAYHAGAAECAYAAGAILSSVTLGALGAGKKRWRLFSLSLCLMGISVFFSGLLPKEGILAFIGLAVLIGGAGNGFTVLYMATLQEKASPKKLGRVIAMANSVMALGAPLGLLVAGPGAQRLGVAWWFVLSGLVLILIGLGTLGKVYRFDCE